MNEARIHLVFRASLLLKGAHALVEIAGGLVLSLTSTAAIARLVNLLTQEELVEDPNDLIASSLLAWAQTFSVQSQHFYAFYLLGHGVVKLLLVAGLLRDRMWAHPASLAVLGAFMAYQLYRYSYTHSVGLLVLTAFDVVVVVLIWHEYRLVRRHTN
ncbi:MAG: DUF2127 domain-containing protein [Alphaproteobacteria bacterium]|nr:DUF2127 domain-containing protein [Alphaproteobacteria bacterium]